MGEDSTVSTAFVLIRGFFFGLEGQKVGMGFCSTTIIILACPFFGGAYFWVILLILLCFHSSASLLADIPLFLFFLFGRVVSNPHFYVLACFCLAPVGRRRDDEMGWHMMGVKCGSTSSGIWGMG